MMSFCLKFAGMISKDGGILLKVYSYYMRSSYLIFGASLLMYIFTEPKPITQKLQTLHYLIALTQIFFKFFSIVLNQTETLQILSSIRTLSQDAMNDPKNTFVVER